MQSTSREGSHRGNTNKLDVAKFIQVVLREAQEYIDVLEKAGAEKVVTSTKKCIILLLKALHLPLWMVPPWRGKCPPISSLKNNKAPGPYRILSKALYIGNISSYRTLFILDTVGSSPTSLREFDPLPLDHGRKAAAFASTDSEKGGQQSTPSLKSNRPR
ncbi:hypothetical protein J6590_000040 [Homalodisca vitripennis]|nr:hypothetical protein J6590_000040 [Homalodisca vitripennis]